MTLFKLHTPFARVDRHHASIKLYYSLRMSLNVLRAYMPWNMNTMTFFFREKKKKKIMSPQNWRRVQSTVTPQCHVLNLDHLSSRFLAFPTRSLWKNNLSSCFM